MSDYILQDITKIEKEEIYVKALRTPITRDIQVILSVCKGVTVWKDDEVHGGVMMIGNQLVGASMGHGKWVPGWPLLINWAHTQADTFDAVIQDEKTADLTIKLGAVSKVLLPNGFFRVTFEKSHTEEVLATIDLFNITP
jgi:hypothetical protein